MKIKKYSLMTLLLYIFIYFLPGFFPTEQSRILATTVAYLIGSILLILFYFRSEKSFSFEQKKSKWWVIFSIGLIGIVAAIFLQNIAVTIESAIFGAPGASKNTENILKIIVANPLFILAVTIGGPIMEEFVFRRAITGLVHSFAPLWFSVAVSSLLFAAIHFDGHIFLYTTLGLFFSYLYIKTGKIWTSIISHVGMNTLVVVASLLINMK